MRNENETHQKKPMHQIVMEFVNKSIKYWKFHKINLPNVLNSQIEAAMVHSPPKGPGTGETINSISLLNWSTVTCNNAPIVIFDYFSSKVGIINSFYKMLDNKYSRLCQPRGLLTRIFLCPEAGIQPQTIQKWKSVAVFQEHVFTKAGRGPDLVRGYNFCTLDLEYWFSIRVLESRHKSF